MKLSDAVKVAIILVVLVGAFFFIKELNNDSLKSPSAQADAEKKEELNREKKLIEELARGESPTLPGKKKPGSGATVHRLNFEKYDYELVRYKRHNPYREDLSIPTKQPKFKDYGKEEAYVDLNDEITSELARMKN